MTPRLKQQYFDEVRDALKKDLGVSNPHQVPSFQKIVVNIGIETAGRRRKIP